AQQRRGLLAGEIPGVSRRDQVRPSDRLDEQTPPGEDDDRVAALVREIRRVVAGVTGGMQGAERQHADREPVTVTHLVHGVIDPGVRGRDDLRARRFGEPTAPETKSLWTCV